MYGQYGLNHHQQKSNKSQLFYHCLSSILVLLLLVILQLRLTYHAACYADAVYLAMRILSVCLSVRLSNA